MTPQRSALRTFTRRAGAFSAVALLAALVASGCQRQSTATPTDAASPAVPPAGSITPASLALADASKSPRPAPAPGASVTELERAFERAAKVIGPSVVSITSVRDSGGRSFFRSRSGKAMGSGVIIDARGYILTNNHVVAKADKLTVKLADDRELEAKVVGTDPHTDIAVIKVQGKNLQPAPLGGSEKLRVGQWVLAVGSPLGLSQSVTAGIISAVDRGDLGIAEYGDFIQTDAAINQGNSGGPLIDLRGRVIGINTAIASYTGGYQGIGFAIPVGVAQPIVKQLLSRGRVVRGWLDVRIQPLTPELAKTFGLKRTKGVAIRDVARGGPAHKGGLLSEDVVVAMNGKAVDDIDAFRTAVANLGPGAKVKFVVIRKGKKRRLTVELGERPAQPSFAATALERIGLAIADPTDRVRKRFGVGVDAGAVIIGVAPGSLAASKDLRPGDVLESIGGKKVKSAQAATRMLEAADFSRGVRVKVRRGKDARLVVLKN